MTIRDKRFEGLGVDLVCDDCEASRWSRNREGISFVMNVQGWRKVDYNRHICGECVKRQEQEQQECEREEKDKMNVRTSVTRIKIDKDGILWMERYLKMKPILCHVSERVGVHCGDHCRLFRDPRVFFNVVSPKGLRTEAFMENCDGSITKLDGYIEERE